MFGTVTTLIIKRFVEAQITPGEMTAPPQISPTKEVVVEKYVAINSHIFEAFRLQLLLTIAPCHGLKDHTRMSVALPPNVRWVLCMRQMSK